MFKGSERESGSSIGFRVQCLGFRVWGMEIGVQGVGCGGSGFGFRVSGLRFRVSGLNDTMWLSISFRKSTPPQNRRVNILIGDGKR